MLEMRLGASTPAATPRTVSRRAGGDVTSTQSNNFTTEGTNQTFGSSVTIKGRVFGMVHASTRTINISAVTGTNTSFAGCIANSTIAMTTAGGDVLIGFVGGYGHSAVSGHVFMYMLVDGVCTDRGSCLGVVINCSDGACFGSHTWNAGVLSAASHSFCFGAYVGSGTWQLNAPNAGGTYTYADMNEFWATEIP